jgi:hypothetical protein
VKRSPIDALCFSQLEADLVDNLSGLPGPVLGDFDSFSRAFEERFDEVVDRRRTRNVELRQMLVEPSLMSSRIRAILAASVYAQLQGKG